MEHKKNTAFFSRWGFILSAVGSAVGMANVWGFPAKMGANGGGAFLLAYLFFIALFSTVGLSAEYAIGRRSRTGTLGSYEKAWESRSPKLGKTGGLLGWLPLAGSMCIAIGATLGAVSWFWVMKKEDLLEEINKGCAKPHGDLWYNAGRFLYVLCALVLCLVALFMKVAF